MDTCAPALRKVTKVILGAIDCPFHFSKSDVDKLERGRGKRGIGWHYLVFPDHVEAGRDLDAPGNHTTGYNADSVGIGIVGGQARGTKRFGNYYAPGQPEIAVKFTQEYAEKFQLSWYHQHQLIKTRNPYFGG